MRAIVGIEIDSYNVELKDHEGLYRSRQQRRFLMSVTSALGPGCGASSARSPQHLNAGKVAIANGGRWIPGATNSGLGVCWCRTAAGGHHARQPAVVAVTVAKPKAARDLPVAPNDADCHGYLAP